MPLRPQVEVKKAEPRFSAGGGGGGGYAPYRGGMGGGGFGGHGYGSPAAAGQCTGVAVRGCWPSIVFLP